MLFRSHSNNVTVIDGAKNVVMGSYDGGKNPYALAIDPSAKYIYAADYGEPSVTAIDVSGTGVQR